MNKKLELEILTTFESGNESAMPRMKPLAVTILKSQSTAAILVQYLKTTSLNYKTA